MLSLRWLYYSPTARTKRSNKVSLLMVFQLTSYTWRSSGLFKGLLETYDPQIMFG